MGKDMVMERIEKKVDEIDRKLDKHIVESEGIRAMVKRHEDILSNGLVRGVEDIKVKIARIEERMEADKRKWDGAYIKLSILALLVGTALNLYMTFS